MRKLRGWLMRWGGLFGKQRQDRELAEELEAHLQMHIEENLGRGMTPEEARRQALIKLGGMEQTKENYRDRRGFPWLESLLQDVRFGLRMLRKNPGFTAVAVLTLAFGIGANTACFSGSIAFLTKSVAFPQLDRLVMVLNLAPKQTVNWTNVSPADFLDWKRQSQSFEEMAAWKWTSWNLTGKGDPEKLDGALVTANFFRTLGVMPAMGRPFQPEEEQPGHGQEAILSYGLWQRRFGSDPNIVGRTIILDHETCDIVAVMGEDFNFPTTVQVWRPLAFSPDEQTLRTTRNLIPFGRLKPGVPLREAAAEMAAIEGRLKRQFPQSETGWDVRVIPIRVFVSGELAGKYSLLMMGAVLFLLLIVCANVANLLFARAASRQKEIAVRLALGASRLRIVRQLLTESVLLAVAGACFGLLLAELGIGLIRYYMPPDVERFLPMWKHVRLEADAFWYTVAIAVFAGLVSGVAPAFQTSGTDIQGELKEGGHGGTESRAGQRLRGIFVVLEVAAALVLLVGAGLMSKGVHALLVVDQNLEPQQILTMSISLPNSKYNRPQQRASFLRQTLERFSKLPGVKSAGVATNVPFGWYEKDGTIFVQGQSVQPGQYLQANMETVNAGYFSVMNIPLREGRLLAETDGADEPPVAVVSESFARSYFHGEDPIGKFIKRGVNDSNSPWIRIVGIVGDIRYNFIGAKEPPAMYLPYQQSPEGFCAMAIRTEGDPATFAAAVRSQIESVDPDQPVSQITTLQKAISNSLLGFSYVAVELSVNGIMALLLASVGVYGVMAYSVTERTHEIGVRMALGAQRRDVLRLLLTRGLVMTLGGLLIGLPTSWVLARLLAGVLFGVSATDLSIFASVTFLMCFIALLACWIPARRAMRVDPMVALRYE